MNWIPHPQTRGSGRPSFALLSVLALLAFACFPVFAQAEESFGPQYETEVPTVTGHTTPPTHSGGGGGTPAHASAANGGSTGSGGGNPSGSGSSGNPSANNPSTGTGQGSQGNGSTAASGQGVAQQQADGLSNGQPVSSQTSSGDSSSSPLIPILIAIAVLAAISIGAVVIRQRRQRRGPGAQVSPKAS